MAGYNRIIMVGNLTRDPEYKQLQSGQGVCRLGLASNRQFKNRQTGDMNQEVCYIDIDVWGAQAESCRNFLQKGRPVLIEGRLKFDSWQDNDGQNRSKHVIVADRVVFLGGAQDDDAVQTGARQQKNVDPVEQELMQQINNVKTRQAARPAPQRRAAPRPAPQQNVADAGTVSLNDEPPFQDDLPF